MSSEKVNGLVSYDRSLPNQAEAPKDLATKNTRELIKILIEKHQSSTMYHYTTEKLSEIMTNLRGIPAWVSVVKPDKALELVNLAKADLLRLREDLEKWQERVRQGHE